MDVITRIVDFIQELFRSASSGYLFFGSAADLFRSFADIALITVLIYLILLFIKQSRAWQLIKGILILYLFVVICSAFGLQMVGFLFSKFLYIFAILFVVLFQPELRRLLETVGIRSFTAIGAVTGTQVENKDEKSLLIDEICDACKEMCKTYTGALILLERKTKLDELLIQENAVKLDSAVNSTVLQSLFYKGAPMHDGAILIRDNKIIGARCHINSQLTMHKLDRAGTRHKAAVAASEMGDTVAIAVSEERGKSSIAVNGKLYEMRNTDELKANLRYILGITDEPEAKSGISKALNGLSKKSKAVQETVKSPKIVVAQSDIKEGKEEVDKVKENNKKKTHGISEKFGMIILSLILSVGLWIYIQINTNPVITKNYVVQITYQDAVDSDFQLSYPIDTVNVKLVGRQKTLDELSANDISATLDVSGVTEPGVVDLPVIVESKDSKVYFRVEQQTPEAISVTVYP